MILFRKKLLLVCVFFIVHLTTFLWLSKHLGHNIFISLFLFCIFVWKSPLIHLRILPLVSLKPPTLLCLLEIIREVVPEFTREQDILVLLLLPFGFVLLQQKEEGNRLWLFIQISISVDIQGQILMFQDMKPKNV